MAIYLGDKYVAFNNVINNSSVVPETLNITTNGRYEETGKVYSPVIVNVDSDATIQHGVLRSDAELIQTYTNNSLIVSGEGVTLPTYATAATTIRAGQNLTPTINIDYDNYNYYILMRTLVIPQYNTNTPVKGRNEYAFAAYQYELTAMPVTLTSLVGNKTYTNTNHVAFHAKGECRLLYWSSATAVSLYASNTYGIYGLTNTPTISSGVMTVKSPYITHRGNTTYLPQAVYESITDIRFQYVLDVYRAPKNHLNRDGWEASQELAKCYSCINNNNLTLT